MVQVTLDKVGVRFQVLAERERSFRRTLAEGATGGRLRSGPKGTLSVSALEDINLHLESGERVALLGHNGAGKTTLLRVLNGVYRPTSGNAVLSGTVGSLIDVSLGMNPEETGRKNIYLRGAMLGLSKDYIDGNFADILEFSGLGPYIDLPLRTYSAGMQLRLSLSVSTLKVPDILVMDEWLAFGDGAFREQAELRLQRLLSESKIFIIASHSRNMVERNCTRGLILQRGRIIKDAPIKEATEYYFSSSPNS